jgi:ribosomal protein S18 acetylase RimI-like enzyme
MTEVDRAVAFIRAYDEALVEQIVPSAHGRALFTPSLPRVHYLNKFSVDYGARCTAEELAEEVEPLFVQAGLAHRTIVGEGELGELLVPAFRERAWQVEDLVLMTHHRPTPDIDTSGVEEVEPDDLEPLWITGMRASPEIGDGEEIRQLVAAQHRRRTAVAVRYFAARVEEEIASYCELFSDGHTGQIESVMTLEKFRGRGLAKAVVTHALTESRAAGYELTFLEADADDWPKELYRKLGFEVAGSTWGFLRRPGVT